MDDERLNTLEARFAWLDRHVAEQDRAMAELGEEMRRVRRETEALRERLRTLDGAGGQGEAGERPPHY
jgi:SlyX protein